MRRDPRKMRQRLSPKTSRFRVKAYPLAGENMKPFETGTPHNGLAYHIGTTGEEHNERSYHTGTPSRLHNGPLTESRPAHDHARHNRLLSEPHPAHDQAAQNELLAQRAFVPREA